MIRNLLSILSPPTRLESPLSIRTADATGQPTSFEYSPGPSDNSQCGSPISSFLRSYFNRGTGPNETTLNRLNGPLRAQLDRQFGSSSELPLYNVYDAGFRTQLYSFLDRQPGDFKRVAIVGPGKNTVEVIVLAARYPHSQFYLIDPHNADSLQASLSQLRQDGVIPASMLQRFHFFKSSLEEADLDGVDLVYMSGVISDDHIIRTPQAAEKFVSALTRILSQTGRIVSCRIGRSFGGVLDVQGFEIADSESEGLFISLKKTDAPQDYLDSLPDTCIRVEDLPAVSHYNEWISYEHAGFRVSVNPRRGLADLVVNETSISLIYQHEKANAYLDKVSGELIIQGPYGAPLYRMVIAPSGKVTFSLSKKLIKLKESYDAGTLSGFDEDIISLIRYQNFLDEFFRGELKMGTQVYRRCELTVVVAD